MSAGTDSDLVPAVEAAKQEGVCVWLAHGRPTPASLWDADDERIELTAAFMSLMAR